MKNLSPINDSKDVVTKELLDGKAASSHSHSCATTSASGFMSNSDKAKLDGIATNANNYSHPNSGATSGTYKNVTVNAYGHVTSGSNESLIKVISDVGWYRIFTSRVASVMPTVLEFAMGTSYITSIEASAIVRVTSCYGDSAGVNVEIFGAYTDDIPKIRILSSPNQSGVTKVSYIDLYYCRTTNNHLWVSVMSNDVDYGWNIASDYVVSVIPDGYNSTIYDCNSQALTTKKVVASNFTGELTGNASTSTKLATARTINGTSFDGTADINIGQLVPISIPANANLNSYTDSGMYYCPANSTVATLTNCPTNSAFSLLVEKHAGTKQTLTWFVPSAPETWMRNLYNGTWGSWYRIYTSADVDAVVTASSSNVITSGAVYNAIQSASGSTITTLYDVDYFNTSIDIPAASYCQYDYLVFVLRYNMNSYGRMAKQTLILSQQEFSYIENGLEIVNQFMKTTSGTGSGKYRFMEYSGSTVYDIILSYQQGPETLNVSHYSPGFYRNLIIIGVKE